MGSNDTLKTAKMTIQAEDQALDGYQDTHVRKARKKERQKGKKIIRKELEAFGNLNKLGKHYCGKPSKKEK